MTKTIFKFVDLLVFTGLFVLAFHYRETNAHIFDLISIAAMIYVMARNPDVNTVTLVTIIIVARAIDTFVFSGYQSANPYLFYLAS